MPYQLYKSTNTRSIHVFQLHKSTNTRSLPYEIFLFDVYTNNTLICSVSGNSFKCAFQQKIELSGEEDCLYEYRLHHDHKEYKYCSTSKNLITRIFIKFFCGVVFINSHFCLSLFPLFSSFTSSWSNLWG